MLIIKVPMSDVDYFDEVTQRFVDPETFDLEIEHSLVSLSKWEAEHEKPFLGSEEKSAEETLSYIKCMTLSEKIPEEIFSRLSKDNFEQIQAYIQAKRTATWFNDRKDGKGGARQIITSAVVYGWMVQLRIPFETQYWHLNELLTLIRVCNEQRAPKKVMSRADAARQQAELNAKRQAEMGTRG